MGKFVISKRFTGDYQFNLKAINGQTILVSEGYSSKEGCKKGIESVVLNSQNDDKYERRSAKDGRYYFNLKASSGEIIGTSQMYESKNGMEIGIESVKMNASSAIIEDYTL
ncbi:YegP family protein [Chryseobacterium indologenes]|uniref:YegP family protein n=1 Tax=Chryseobacterium indologenes TaxID=253 RepID=UPI001BCD5010|nr:YegP family protein [Chryseobacterium indologenes]